MPFRCVPALFCIDKPPWEVGSLLSAKVAALMVVGDDTRLPQEQAEDYSWTIKKPTGTESFQKGKF